MEHKIEYHLEIKDVENMTREEMIESMRKMEDIIIRKYRELTSLYLPNQTFKFCENPNSILTEDTCCTGCSKLNEK